MSNAGQSFFGKIGNSNLRTSEARILKKEDMGNRALEIVNSTIGGNHGKCGKLVEPLGTYSGELIGACPGGTNVWALFMGFIKCGFIRIFLT